MGSLVLKDDSLNLVPLDHGSHIPGLCFWPRTCGLLDEGTIHNLEVRCPPSTKGQYGPIWGFQGGPTFLSCEYHLYHIQAGISWPEVLD